MEYLRTNKHFAVASPTMTCVTNATLLGPWQLIKVSFTILAGVWHCKMCMHSLIMDATCLMSLPRCPQNKTRLDRAHHKAGSEATSRRHRTLHKFCRRVLAVAGSQTWPRLSMGACRRGSSQDQAPHTFQNGTAVLPPLKGLKKPHRTTKRKVKALLRGSFLPSFGYKAKCTQTDGRGIAA